MPAARGRDGQSPPRRAPQQSFASFGSDPNEAPKRPCPGSDPRHGSKAQAPPMLVTLPDGCNLNVEEVGSGFPLIVLHGGPGLDHSMFRPYLDSLGDEFRL